MSCTHKTVDLDLTAPCPRQVRPGVGCPALVHAAAPLRGTGVPCDSRASRIGSALGCGCGGWLSQDRLSRGACAPTESDQEQAGRWGSSLLGLPALLPGSPSVHCLGSLGASSSWGPKHAISPGLWSCCHRLTAHDLDDLELQKMRNPCPLLHQPHFRSSVAT